MMTKHKYEVVIKSMWIMLFAYFIIKIFGGNYFEIVCNWKTFKSVCDFIDNHLVVKMIVACANLLFSSYFILCALYQKKHLSKKDILIFLPLHIAKSVLGWYIPILSFVLDIVILIIIPTIQLKSIKRPLITCGLMIMFQIISIITKNLSLHKFMNNATLVNLIYSIDYIVMIIMYYLYTLKKKGGK